MKICRVEGTVVATEKHPKYLGKTLLVVQPLDERQQPEGSSYLAVDRVQAGKGDTVLVLREGNGARQIFQQENLPVRGVIVGIVDQVDVAQ